MGSLEDPTLRSWMGSLEGAEWDPRRIPHPRAAAVGPPDSSRVLGWSHISPGIWAGKLSRHRGLMFPLCRDEIPKGTSQIPSLGFQRSSAGEFLFLPPIFPLELSGDGGRAAGIPGLPALAPLPTGNSRLGKRRGTTKPHRIILKIRDFLLKSPCSFGFRGCLSKCSILPKNFLSQGIGNVRKGSPKFHSEGSGPLLPQPGSDPRSQE